MKYDGSAFEFLASQNIRNCADAELGASSTHQDDSLATHYVSLKSKLIAV
jgi:hypothetical protein